MKTKLELLSPAGNTERLNAALRYGADAVYLGANAMSLRNFAANFTPEELKQACDKAHALNKKIYVACNAFAKDGDMDALPELLLSVAAADADALIVNDPGVIRTARRTLPDMPLHLSTQANTLNSEAALFWHDQGICRIILARELSLEEIKRMRERLPDDVELEMFVHGAMCVSYSGRCLLSNYLDGRDSNRGECAQPCRWTYELRERGKDGEYFQIEEDERGTFILNSKDLNLIEHIAEIADAGVMSLKIEGRMKSVAYVATITNAYRMAIDAYTAGQPLPDNVRKEPEYASHRPYTTGFAFGKPSGGAQAPKSSGYITNADIAAVVLDYDEAAKRALIEQRNRFFNGDTLNILSAGDISRCFTVNDITDTEGNAVMAAPHPKEKLYIGCAESVMPGDILRLFRTEK